jgi:serine/threonine protein kinase
MTTHQ